MKNPRLLNGVNNPHDVAHVDPFSFQFHGPKKAMFYALIKLIKPIPDEVLDRIESPLGKVLVKRYRDYLEHEKQEWRREVLSKTVPFLICLVCEEGDLNYHEVFVYLLYGILQDYENGDLEIPLAPLDPYNWWADEHGCRVFLECSYQGKTTTNKVIPDLPKFGEIMEVT